MEKWAIYIGTKSMGKWPTVKMHRSFEEAILIFQARFDEDVSYMEGNG